MHFQVDEKPAVRTRAPPAPVEEVERLDRTVDFAVPEVLDGLDIEGDYAEEEEEEEEVRAQRLVLIRAKHGVEYKSNTRTLNLGKPQVLCDCCGALFLMAFEQVLKVHES